MRQNAWALNESGAGSVIAIALMVALSGLGMLFLVQTNSVVMRVSVEQAADNAAIAAADSLRGLTTGTPCESAELVAVRSGFAVKRCQFVGNDVLVELVSGSITARARAGEPG